MGVLVAFSVFEVAVLAQALLLSTSAADRPNGPREEVVVAALYLLQALPNNRVAVAERSELSRHERDR